jgi:tetratricopeptide (TPR) repeat protein
VRKNPDLGAYHAALGEQWASRPTPERLKQARAELEQAVALDPKMVLNSYQLGVVLQKLEDEDGARRAFLQALDRDSTRLDAYAGVMVAARSLGQSRIAAFFARLERETRDRQRDEAAARLDLSVRPRDAGAHLRLARLLLQRGDLAGARDHLAIASEQPGGSAARPLLQRAERLLSVL